MADLNAIARAANSTAPHLSHYEPEHALEQAEAETTRDNEDGELTEDERRAAALLAAAWRLHEAAAEALGLDPTDPAIERALTDPNNQG